MTDLNAPGNVPDDAGPSGATPSAAPSEGLVPVSQAPGYGPSAIATPANFVTVIRLLVSPLLFAMISDEPSGWLVWMGARPQRTRVCFTALPKAAPAC